MKREWTKEEIIVGLEGMLWMGGLCRTEREYIQGAIDLLKGEEDEHRIDENAD